MRGQYLCAAMPKVNNTIPVYDICSLNGSNHLHDDIIADNLAHYLAQHSNLYFPHRHSFYHIMLFTAGGGSHTIDFEQFEVKPGQLYFMIPGQVHTWSFKGNEDGYIINCSEALINAFLPEEEVAAKMPLLRGIASDSVINLAAKPLKRVGALMQAIINEVQNHDRFTRAMVCAHLMELFVTVARESNAALPAGALQQNYLVLYNFRKLVGEYYASKHLPKDYASLLYITPNHLNAVCNELLGKPAGEVIRDRVLLEAKRLLVNAGLGVAEIAWQLGFSDNSYFTKFFKKYEGVTPEEFRKSYLTKETNTP